MPCTQWCVVESTKSQSQSDRPNCGYLDRIVLKRELCPQRLDLPRDLGEVTVGVLLAVLSLQILLLDQNVDALLNHRNLGFKPGGKSGLRRLWGERMETKPRSDLVENFCHQLLVFQQFPHLHDPHDGSLRIKVKRCLGKLSLYCTLPGWGVSCPPRCACVSVPFPASAQSSSGCWCLLVVSCSCTSWNKVTWREGNILILLQYVPLKWRNKMWLSWEAYKCVGTK